MVTPDMKSRLAAPDPRPRPWWRFGYVWLVIGSFAVAVVAGIVTLYLAVQAPEPSVASMPEAEQQGALEPAMQARNRASSSNARALGLGRK